MGLFSSKNKDKSAKPSDHGSVTLEDGVELKIAQQVDCLGDSCPRPQLLTKKAVANVQPGEVVEILVDNPTSMEALPPMCDSISATHLTTQKSDKGWRVYIQKN